MTPIGLPIDPTSVTSLQPTSVASSGNMRMDSAAKDFEAMAIDQMLEPMFKTVETEKSLFGGGSAEAAWKPMLIEQIARQMAATDLFGLAEPIRRAMQLMQEAKAK